MNTPKYLSGIVVTFTGIDAKDNTIESASFKADQLRESFLKAVNGLYKGNQWGKTYTENLKYFEDRLINAFDAHIEFFKKSSKIGITFEVTEEGYTSPHKTKVTANLITDKVKKDYRAWELDLRTFSVIERGTPPGTTGKEKKSGESEEDNRLG